MGLPGRRAVFPLVVSELLDLGAVVVHDKDLAVRLRIIREQHFIFESHA